MTHISHITKALAFFAELMSDIVHAIKNESITLKDLEGVKRLLFPGYHQPIKQLQKGDVVVDHIKLYPGPKKALAKAKILTVFVLVRKTPEELKKFKGVSSGSIKSIAEQLRTYRLHLGMNDDEIKNYFISD